MEKEVLEVIKENNLINRNENILVGVSGGPDSMALLYLLIKIKEIIGFNLLIGHVNHGVRGEAALADQLFVERKAKELRLPYFFKAVDMERHARERGISPEEAGRELRYGFFREVLEKLGGGKIAVAHNRNDQAETLLMRILRGTGIDGLKGMDYIKGNIIRPLLNISREDIEEYIDSNNIESVLDLTNLETIYTRNKVRLELLPYLKENFNPNIIDSLWRLSKTAQIDSKFLEDCSNNKYNVILKNKTNNSIILDLNLFKKEGLSIQQRLIRRAILDMVGNLQGFSEQHISMVLDLLSKGQTGKKVHIANGLMVRLDYDNLIFQKNIGPSQDYYEHKLSLGINDLKALGLKIQLKLLDKNDDMAISPRGENISYFDYDKIQGDLLIRNRKAGDRFRPFGMKGSKKLKDYFIDEKISRDLRDKIPLLADEENILWVMGHRTGESYRVNIDTKNILMIEYYNREDKDGE